MNAIRKRSLAGIIFSICLTSIMSSGCGGSPTSLERRNRDQSELIRRLSDEILSLNREIEQAGDQASVSLTQKAQAEKELQALLHRGDLQLYSERKGLKFVFPEDKLFEPGQVTLIAEASEVLDPVARLLTEKFPKHRVYIHAFTDSQPLLSRGWPTPWFFTSSRANQIIQYWVEDKKMNPSRFVSVSWGAGQPISSEETEEGRRANCRIEISLISPEMGEGL